MSDDCLGDSAESNEPVNKSSSDEFRNNGIYRPACWRKRVHVEFAITQIFNTKDKAKVWDALCLQGCKPSSLFLCSLGGALL